MPEDSTSSRLNVNDLLIAEFNYIAQTAFQANEDRSRVSNFYFVTAGAAIGAILSAKIESDAAAGVYAGLSGLFLVLTCVGSFTLLQLARLRTAWEESARAMNVIKDYYRKCADTAGLDAALFWRMQTVPKGRNWKTVAFLLAFSVLAICVGTTTAFFVYAAMTWLAVQSRGPTGLEGLGIGAVGILLGIGVAIGQYLIYENWIRDAEKSLAKRISEHYAKYKPLLPDLIDAGSPDK